MIVCNAAEREQSAWCFVETTVTAPVHQSPDPQTSNTLNFLRTDNLLSYLPNLSTSKTAKAVSIICLLAPNEVQCLNVMSKTVADLGECFEAVVMH